LKSAVDGPFRYLNKNNWVIKRGLEDACKNKEIRNPMIKLRGIDRAVIEKHLSNNLSNKKCNWFN
jgi:hypothetical protein